MKMENIFFLLLKCAHAHHPCLYKQLGSFGSYGDMVEPQKTPEFLWITPILSMQSIKIK